MIRSIKKHHITITKALDENLEISKENKRKVMQLCLWVSCALLSLLCIVFLLTPKTAQPVNIFNVYNDEPDTTDAYDNNSNQFDNSKLYSKYIAKSDVNALDATKGEKGGQWTWCTHLSKYGPNFDRGLANFLSGILRPSSALEFGCGVGLYINYIEHYTTSKNKDPSKFIGIEPESMIDAGVFGSDKFQATQLAMNVFEAPQTVLDSLGEFDLVFSSEVAEHIPLALHDKMYDFLVAKTGKFLVFGAARNNQGGTGHLRESMHNMPYWIEKFEAKGMIHVPKISERLRDSCYNKWDKGANSFVMINKSYYDKFDDLEMLLGGLDDVSDIFPSFYNKYIDLKKNTVCT